MHDFEAHSRIMCMIAWRNTMHDFATFWNLVTGDISKPLAANSSSPSPSSVSSFLSPLPSSAKAAKLRPKSSLRARNCETPEPRKVKCAEETIRELQKALRSLETEMGRMKKDHSAQLRKKDEIIQELTQKAAANKGSSVGGAGDGEGVKFLVTRASLRPKNNNHTNTSNNNGEIKTPRHRFQSPVQDLKSMLPLMSQLLLQCFSSLV